LTKRRRIFFVVITALIIVSILLVSAGAETDNAYWEGSDIYLLLEYGKESNSAVDNAIVKVKFDYDVNRIYLLFMITVDTFNNIALSGLQMSFNSLGTITFSGDSDQSFDNENYYSSMETKFDKNTKTILFDVVVGIKSGIPDNINMKVRFTDTDGVQSNDFNQNITPKVANSCENSLNSSDEKTKKLKSTKAEKVKTAKSGTTKKTKENGDNEESESSSQQAQQVLGSDELNDPQVSVDDDKKTLVWVAGAAAAAVGVGAGCTVGIRKRITAKNKEGAEKK
jgi:hypothetical protein